MAIKKLKIIYKPQK